MDIGGARAVAGSGDADAKGCEWVFKEGGSETTRLMNLVNLPMLKSSAVRKLTNEKVVPLTKQTHESLKQQIKMEFARSMGLISSDSDHKSTDNGDGDQGQGQQGEEPSAKKQKLQKGQMKKSQSDS